MHSVNARAGEAVGRSSPGADAAQPSTRTARLVRAVTAKINSQNAVIDQSEGAVRLTAHPRGTDFKVELDVKL